MIIKLVTEKLCYDSLVPLPLQRQYYGPVTRLFDAINFRNANICCLHSHVFAIIRATGESLKILTSFRCLFFVSFLILKNVVICHLPHYNNVQHKTPAHAECKSLTTEIKRGSGFCKYWYGNSYQRRVQSTNGNAIPFTNKNLHFISINLKRTEILRTC